MTTDLNSEKKSLTTARRRHAGRAGLMGPVLLLTLGVMFLVGQFVPEWGVGRTWPVLLIVVGLTKLVESAWARRSTPFN